MPEITYSEDIDFVRNSFASNYDPSNKHLNDVAKAERDERYQQITRFWDYYKGNHPKPIKPKLTEDYDDNVIFNLCGQAIDKTVAFLFPKAPRLEFEDDNLELQAQEIWSHNEVETFVVNLGLSGTITGHNFVRLYMDSEGIPAPAILDGRTVTVFWDVRDVRRPLWYRITWETINVNTGTVLHWQDFVPVKVVEPGNDSPNWLIIEYLEEPGRAVREIRREDWPFPFSPIVDWKNNPAPFSYYGPSDLRHFHVNDVLNFVASNTGRILRFHAHPKTIVLGVAAHQIEETAINSAWAIPTSDAEVFNLEMQSDLHSSMEMQDRARAAFFAQMRVVDMATHKDKIGQITNFGLHVLFSDMLDMIKIKQQLYGKGLRIVTQRLLMMAGNANVPLPSLVWEEALPVNRTEMVNAATIEQRLGFTSDQTLAEDLGRDFDQELRRLIGEKERKMAEEEEKLRRQFQLGNQFPVNVPPQQQQRFNS